MSGSPDGTPDLRSDRGEAVPDLLLVLCSREAAAGFEHHRRPPTPPMSRNKAQFNDVGNWEVFWWGKGEGPLTRGMEHSGVFTSPPSIFRSYRIYDH